MFHHGDEIRKRGEAFREEAALAGGSVGCGAGDPRRRSPLECCPPGVNLLLDGYRRGALGLQSLSSALRRGGPVRPCVLFLQTNFKYGLLSVKYEIGSSRARCGCVSRAPLSSSCARAAANQPSCFQLQPGPA